MRFLDFTGGKSALTSCLCVELFPWSFYIYEQFEGHRASLCLTRICITTPPGPLYDCLHQVLINFSVSGQIKCTRMFLHVTSTSALKVVVVVPGKQFISTF